MMRLRKTAVIQLAILMVLGLAIVLSLLLPELTASSVQQPLTEISLFLQEEDMALSSNTRLGMEAAAMEYGGELRFISPTGDATAQAQIETITREVEGGSVALIVSPVDTTALDEALSSISLPIIAMESPLTSASLFISPDNEAVGTQLAQAVIADTLSGDTVLLLDSTQSRSGIALRMDACVSTLEDSGRIVHITTTSQGETMTSAAAVVALEDDTTLQLARLQLSQDIDFPLYGVGGNAEIASHLERGTLDATVAWSDYAVGYLAVQTAISTALKQSVITPSIAITTIRGETIYDSDNQKLLFPVV